MKSNWFGFGFTTLKLKIGTTLVLPFVKISFRNFRRGGLKKLRPLSIEKTKYVGGSRSLKDLRTELSMLSFVLIFRRCDRSIFSP